MQQAAQRLPLYQRQDPEIEVVVLRPVVALEVAVATQVDLRQECRIQKK